MPSTWSASRGVSLEASRILVERAHQELLTGNSDDPRLEFVRPLVRESWSRSLNHEVPAEGLPPIVMVDDELERYRQEHPLADAMAMIRSLLLPGDPEDSGVLVAVGDHAGQLLWVEGDLQQRIRSGEIGLVPGASWSESDVGTAAPGLALALGSSVQVHESEHFNRLIHSWSCTAAPVFDPETKRILGMIDVSGGSEVVTPQARLLVDAAARAVESQLLVTRLRARHTANPPRPSAPKRTAPMTHFRLRVLGRDNALLEAAGSDSERIVELSARHSEIMLMLANHSHGLSADRLTRLVYGDDGASTALRPEMVRLRKVLQKIAPELIPASRPYRLDVPLETDARNMLTLLDRGALRVALSVNTGPVLPSSTAPGVEDFRDGIRLVLRDVMLMEADAEILLAYADSPDGAEDEAVLRLCLEMLPPRSPRRPALVARIEQLQRA